MSANEARNPASDGRAPRAVRIVGSSLLALALAGAFYLVWARGEAIVVDLSALAGKVWCF